MRPHLRLLLQCLLLPAAVLACAQLRAQGFLDAGVELSHNGNPGRFITPGAASALTTLSLNGGYHLQPGLFTGLDLRAGLRGSFWQQHSGLDSMAGLVEARLSHKFGIGELQPVLRAGLQLERQVFRQGLRDSNLGTLYLALGKRLSPRLALELRLQREHSDGDSESTLPLPPIWAPGAARPGSVWDFQATALGLSGEYELGASNWLDASFLYRDGPVVAGAAAYLRPNPAALAVTADPVFGPQAASYRIDARSRVLSINYNHSWRGHLTWYGGIEYQHATASSGVDYGVRLLRVGYLHAF